MLAHVFVSSTYLDLESYRAAVTRAVITAGDMPSDMVYWPATEEPPVDACLSRVRASDLVILLIGHRYGYVPPGSATSITELEFDEATARGVPVLAFLVAPDHPWPPKWIDRDPDAVNRLTAFRTRVSQMTTPQRFTSPDSLETAVTHAVAAFRNRRAAQQQGAQHGMRSFLNPQPSDVLRYAPDANVRIGLAPDGAPLVLRVNRAVDVDAHITELAAAVGAPNADGALARIRDELSQQAKAHAVSRNIFRCESPDGPRDCYVSTRTMSALFAPSLLESVIGGDFGDDETDYDMAVRGRRRGPRGTPTTTGAGLMSPGGPDRRVKSTGGRNRFLCVPLDGDPKPWSGGWEETDGTKNVHLWRPFGEESFERFAEIQYELRRRNALQNTDETIYRGSDRQQYLDRWVEALERDEPLTAALHSRITVSREALVNFLLSVTKEIAERHDRGEIHGDIKPSNVLAARSGLAVIDAVGLEPGEVSPLVTAGWSPPEQLTRRALHCSADVFTLALLFLRALGGHRLGRVVKFRMPDDMEAALVEDPTVYFAAEDRTLIGPGRSAWAQILEASLRSEPSARLSPPARI